MPSAPTAAAVEAEERILEQPTISPSENGEAQSTSSGGATSGVTNPLDNNSRSTGRSGRIWYSTLTSGHGYAFPTSATGEPSSRTLDMLDGWSRTSRRHRVCGRTDRLWAIQAPFKDLQKQHGQWNCFLCCHVRTGTIVIGFWHLLLHLLALALIAFVMIHPNVLTPMPQEPFDNERLAVSPAGTQDVQAVNCSEMPCLLATQNGQHRHAANEIPLVLGNLLSTHKLNSEDVNVALFIYLCTFVVTVLLIYGAFKGQPSYLMPFFFLQVFDFCISSMTMIGYLSYLPSVRQAIQKSPNFPFRSELLAMNSKCLTFFVMLFCILTFMVKAYVISVVWRCYKYLMHKIHLGRWPACAARTNHLGPVDQESQTLVLGHDLPDYDTAISDPQYRKKVSSLFPEPPPSYDMAMAAYHAQQRILDDVQQAQVSQVQSPEQTSTETDSRSTQPQPSVQTTTATVQISSAENA